MGMFFGMLGSVFSLGSLVCFILVLIKLFKAKGPLHGILGLICGLYTFIWGWMSLEHNRNNAEMIGWTVFIVGSVAFNTLSGVFASQ